MTPDPPLPADPPAGSERLSEETARPTSPHAGFSYIDHPADVWVHAWGPTLEAAIEQCVYSLMDTMVGESQIQEKEMVPIQIEEQTEGSLLVAFLSEFLFLFDTEGWLIRRVDCQPIETLPGGQLILNAKTYGEQFDPAVHEPDTEVKAITYSYLEITDQSGRTDIKIVFDI